MPLKLSFRSFFLICSLLSCIFPCIPSEAQEIHKTVVADQAVVASAHPLATQIGKEILQKGGNAFDAAIAVEFALAVCYPIAGNIGGGGLLVFRDANSEYRALDYREKAPLLANRDMYLDENGEAVANKSRYGHLAAGVPGTVAGMVALHQAKGSLPWKDLVQPALDLAKKGVPLTQREASNLNQYKNDFLQHNTHTPYLVNLMRDWQKDDVLPHKALAKTLQRIAKKGFDGFYAGKTAAAIVKEMATAEGLISLEDLKSYQAVWRQPLVGFYKQHKIITMPPPSAGGALLLQMLAMVEPFQLEKYNIHAPEAIQIMVEAERRAYADRATYFGDPDFVSIPLDSLLSPLYLKNRMQDFDWQQATPSQNIQAGKFQSTTKSEETTHYAVLDSWGNAVAATTTLNGAYGSKVVVKEAGFLLNNEMDDFSAKPNAPNLYGLVGSQANAIAPGKRMLSSMTPTIVEKEGKLWAVVGTPGGSTITTSVFQILLNLIDFGCSPEEAVNKARFHHQWLPDKIFMERSADFSEILKNALREKKYLVEERDNIGRVELIFNQQESGKKIGVADWRGDDATDGF
ncbi:MAG TPA: gamma-glutamyltransferase [Microscillaceae bacterium]|nr:gamma-glutamyltransferase [Microscillaceae bacterium]